MSDGAITHSIIHLLDSPSVQYVAYRPNRQYNETMLKLVQVVLSFQVVLVAAFSSSSTYQLNSYGIGPGGTNSSSSSTYKLQGNAGEQTNGATAGSTKTANNGAVQTEQLNTPPAPTLTNGANYYNQLTCVVNTGSNPTDTVYAIAINTTNSFAGTTYVQADGTIGASAVYQTYTAWGGASGFQIVGLSPSTTYYVKAAAKQGMFTNTALSPTSNSAATVSPTLSFSVSPNSASFGSFAANTVVTSGSISFTYATNGTSGGSIYVLGKNGGFYSPSRNSLIAAVSGDLSSLGQGFGLQATGVSQTSGGPLSILSPFNGSSHVVGTIGTSFAQLFTTPAAITGGSAAANVQVKATNTTPASNDYSETLTFIASASF